MLKTRKGDRVLLLVHVNGGLSPNNVPPRLMITRSLPDTPEARKDLADAIAAVPAEVVVPLPAWIGGGRMMEAVVTPDLPKLHAAGGSLQEYRFKTCPSRVEQRLLWVEPRPQTPPELRAAGEPRPWGEYGRYTVREARQPAPFHVGRERDEFSAVIFPDEARLKLFGVTAAQLRVACHQPGQYWTMRTEVKPRPGLVVPIGELATVVSIAETVLFRADDESVEAWERRVAGVVRSRPDEYRMGGPQPKYDCYQQLSTVHGAEGLALLEKIGQDDPRALNYLAKPQGTETRPATAPSGGAGER